MLIQDPMTGEVYDDGSDDFGGQPGYGYNQTSLFNFMQPQASPSDPYNWQGIAADLAAQPPTFASPAYSTTKSMFGRELPMGQPQRNQQFTGAKNYNQLLTNPSVLYNTEVQTGATTMDPNALQGLDQYGMPLGSLPGGGGVGGGPTLGYKPVFTTPNLDRIAGSDDEISKLIMLGITKNQSGAKIKSDIRSSPMGKKMTDAELKDYSYDVDQALREYSDKSRNDQLGQLQSQQPQQSAIQQWMGKAGLQNPLQQYDETNLPGDVDLSAIEAANMKGVQQGTLYDQKIKALQRQAESLGTQAHIAADPTNPWRAFSDPIGLAHTMGQDYVPRKVGATGVPVSMNKGGIVDGGFGLNLPQRGQVDPTIMTGPGFTTTVRQGDSGRRQEELRKRGTPAQRIDPRIQQQQQRVNTQIQLQRNLKGAQDRGTQEYNDAVRRMAVQGLREQGRTPARDAQQRVINYLRSGGMAV